MMANDEFIQAQMGSRGFTSNVVSASGTPFVLAAYLLFLRQSRCPHCHPSCCESWQQTARSRREFAIEESLRWHRDVLRSDAFP